MATSNGTELVVNVPQGGQVIKTYNLTPKLPVDGKISDWLWADVGAPTTQIAAVRVKFNINSSAMEQDFERAILVINLQQNSNNNGYWRFVQNGVAINPEYKDIYHNVDFEVIDDGATLIAHVQVIGETLETIKFSFLASFTDAVSGVVTTYESQDPDIIPGRP